jgi:hypothetical protein
MGQRVIDKWAQDLIGKPFKWGETDCHQVTVKFIQLDNIRSGIQSPLYSILDKKYTNWREANEVAKELDIPTWLEDLGYRKRLVINRLERGDIIRVTVDTRAYDLYMPVIFGETILYSNLKSRRITLTHGSEMQNINRHFEVYRRNEW